MNKFFKKNKKALKDEDLNTIEKLFDDFQFQDSEEEIFKRKLSDYISYAIE